MIDLISRMNELRKAAETRNPDSPEVFPGRTIEDGLVDLYRKIKAMDDALESKRAENPEALLRHDPALEALGDKFHAIWQSLTDQQRRQVVDKLTENRILPEFVGKTIDLFGGRIISMVGER